MPSQNLKAKQFREAFLYSFRSFQGASGKAYRLLILGVLSTFFLTLVKIVHPRLHASLDEFFAVFSSGLILIFLPTFLRAVELLAECRCEKSEKSSD